MELILLIGFAALIIGIGVYRLVGRLFKKPEPKQTVTSIFSNQRMVFMNETRVKLEELMYDLTCKVTARSRDVAKADGRFLVTPEDMRKAYEEIIREEHM